MEPAAQVEGGVPGMGVLIDNRSRRARAGAARKRAAPSPWLSAGGKKTTNGEHGKQIRTVFRRDYERKDDTETESSQGGCQTPTAPKTCEQDPPLPLRGAAAAAPTPLPHPPVRAAVLRRRAAEPLRHAAEPLRRSPRNRRAAAPPRCRATVLPGQAQPSRAGTARRRAEPSYTRLQKFLPSPFSFAEGERFQCATVRWVGAGRTARAERQVRSGRTEARPTAMGRGFVGVERSSVTLNL